MSIDSIHLFTTQIVSRVKVCVLSFCVTIVHSSNRSIHCLIFTVSNLLSIVSIDGFIFCQWLSFHRKKIQVTLQLAQIIPDNDKNNCQLWKSIECAFIYAPENSFIFSQIRLCYIVWRECNRLPIFTHKNCDDTIPRFFQMCSIDTSDRNECTDLYRRRFFFEYDGIVFKCE